MMPTISLTMQDVELLGRALAEYLDRHPLEAEKWGVAAFAWMLAPDDLTEKAVERFDRTQEKGESHD